MNAVRASTHDSTTPRTTRRLLAKVPEITIAFWVLKLLTTGMGEAMSDFLGQHSVPIAAAIGIFGLAFAIWLQLRQHEYRAPYYWFAVMMVAVFGTMAADGIHDGADLSYYVTTPLFALITAAIFASGIAAKGRCRSTASTPGAARSSTGPRCSPRSRSAPPPAT